MFGRFDAVHTPSCVLTAEEVDYLFVGALLEYKRPELLLTKPGRRAAVGRIDMAPDMLVGATA